MTPSTIAVNNADTVSDARPMAIRVVEVFRVIFARSGLILPRAESARVQFASNDQVKQSSERPDPVRDSLMQWQIMRILAKRAVRNGTASQRTVAGRTQCHQILDQFRKGTATAHNADRSTTGVFVMCFQRNSKRVINRGQQIQR